MHWLRQGASDKEQFAELSKYKAGSLKCVTTSQKQRLALVNILALALLSLSLYLFLRFGIVSWPSFCFPITLCFSRLGALISPTVTAGPQDGPQDVCSSLAVQTILAVSN